MSFSRNKIKPNNVDLISAQTLENKAIVDPTRTDVYKDTLAGLQAHAASGDGTNGQFCFDTENNKMYQIIGNALIDMTPTSVLEARVFALENPLTQLNSRFHVNTVNSNYTLSNTDLTATYATAGAGIRRIAAYIDFKCPVDTGKYYSEFVVDVSGTEFAIGGALYFDSAGEPENDCASISGDFGVSGTQVGYYANGTFFYVAGTSFAITDSSPVGTKVTIAIDNILNEVYVAIDGVWQFGADPVLGTGGKPDANLGLAATSFSFGTSVYNDSSFNEAFSIVTTPSIILADWTYVG